MEFLEKDLENIIWEASSEQLDKVGLEFRGKRFRQLRIGNYGVADLVTVERKVIFSEMEYIKTGKYKIIDSYLEITVYELKKDKIGIGALMQAISYVKGIKQYLNKRNFESFVFKIVLIGSDIDTTGSFCFFPDLINICEPCDEPFYSIGSIIGIDYYTYSFKIDGIKFKNKSGYRLTNEGF